MALLALMTTATLIYARLGKYVCTTQVGTNVFVRLECMARSASTQNVKALIRVM